VTIDIPTAWRQLDLAALSGTLMVIGAPDVGKSTFARYLFERLQSSGICPAFLDGDPGQSSLGPPTTLTLTLCSPTALTFPPQGSTWRWFTGSTSPAGHMLPVLVGAARLIDTARSAGAQAIVYDTSGLVDPAAGGAALKFAKIDLLQPAAVFAIQKADELEPILQPLRRSRRTRLVVLDPSNAARRRDTTARQDHRSDAYKSHFANARSHWIEWSQYAVLPYPQFALQRLVALEDAAGYTRALGVIQSIERSSRRLELLTPLQSFDKIATLHLGDLLLDPASFRDRRL
jgi:polynucleotide 5'-hydroxyl-kinase GRC3/NOL9